MECSTTTITNIMLEAMNKLKNKEITTQEAQSIALLGKVGIDSARVELDFIKTVKAIPKGSSFSNQLQYMEPPEPEKEALEHQAKRIQMENELLDLIPPKTAHG